MARSRFLESTEVAIYPLKGGSILSTCRLLAGDSLAADLRNVTTGCCEVHEEGRNHGIHTSRDSLGMNLALLASRDDRTSTWAQPFLTEQGIKGIMSKRVPTFSIVTTTARQSMLITATLMRAVRGAALVRKRLELWYTSRRSKAPQLRVE